MKVGATKRSEECVFGAIWQNTIDGVRVIDSSGRIIYVNEAFCRLTGKTEDELIGEIYFFSFSANNEFFLDKSDEFREKFDSRKIIPFYRAKINLNNTPRLLEVTNTYINNKDDIMLLISVFHEAETGDTEEDFSAFEKADPIPSDLLNQRINELEILLQKEKEKSIHTGQIMKAILENVDDVIWIMNKELKFTYISPSVIKVRGYTVEEAMSQTLEKSMSPESYKYVVETIERKMRGGVEELKKTELIEAQHPRKDGTLVWVESKVKFLLDEEGNPIGILGLSRDISNRKKAEQLLRQSENYLASIINNIGDPLFVKDSSYKCVLANEAFCRILNRNMKDVVGKYDHELFDRFDCEMFNVQDEFVLKTGKESLNEEYFIDAEGKKHFVLTKKILFKDENGEKFIVGTITDISEFKEIDRLLRSALEKEKSLNALKTDFVSMVSHEFRTPLTTILSSSQLLQQYYDDMQKEEKTEIFGHIYNGVQKMIMLLDDILLLGSTESGKIVFSPAMVNIHSFCQNIEKELKISNGNHKINLSIESSTGKMYVDERLMNHILINLLTNAVKYSPGGTEINFKIYEQGKYLCFDVEDFGIGINPEERKKVFEPFFRGTNTMGISGTGLGLAIVKRSVDLHKGNIECIGGKDKGTIFKVKIPLNL